MENTNTEIYRIGDDIDSDYFGNSAFSKICRVNDTKTDFIYLKHITSKFTILIFSIFFNKYFFPFPFFFLIISI